MILAETFQKKNWGFPKIRRDRIRQNPTSASNNYNSIRENFLQVLLNLEKKEFILDFFQLPLS